MRNQPKSKKHYIASERQQEIERENKVLVQKMSSIMLDKTRSHSTKERATKSLNHNARKR